MIFLIEYDRAHRQLLMLKAFEDSERSKAEDSRLRLELRLHQRGDEHEVVLLEAADEDAIRRTHRRYFESIEDLATMPPSNRSSTSG